MFSAKKFLQAIGVFPSTPAPVPYSQAFGQSTEDKERQIEAAKAKRLRKQQRRLEIAAKNGTILLPN